MTASSLHTERPDCAPDPYPRYRALREHTPVLRLADGVVFLTRHADVAALLRDRERYAPDRPRASPLLGPALDALGSVWDAELVQAAARCALRAHAGSTLDAPRFAQRVVSEALARAFGVSSEPLIAAAHAPAAVEVKTPAYVHATRARGPLETYLQLRATQQGGGSPENLLAAMTEECAGLGEPEIAVPRVAAQLLSGALCSTAQLLTQLLHRLASAPELQRRVRLDHALLRPLIFESLRHDAPIQSLARRARVDVEIAGERLPAGTQLLAGVGAANRDPAVCPDPERFDLTRGPTQHLAFGAGESACRAASMAVMCAETTLRELLEASGTFVLRAGAETVRASQLGLRGFTRLELSIEVPRTLRLLEGGRASAGGRLARMAAFSGRAAAMAAANKVRSRFASPVDAERLQRDMHMHTARELLGLLGDLRAMSTKLGQLLSFMDVGLPEEYRAVLQSLQELAPALPAADVDAVLQSELGGAAGELFAEFAPVPIARASIGQVHRATLHDGRAVAVKIQYPGVREAIHADFANLALITRMSRVMERVLGFQLDASSLVEEARARIFEETDYLREAATQTRFRAHYRDQPGIVVPEVIASRSSPRVLTSEWMDGSGWSVAKAAPQALRDAWGEAIFRFVYQSLYALGEFNGDPHPGNYVFRADGSVAFLDFGCVHAVAPAISRGLRAAADAILRADGQGLLLAFRDLGYVDDPARFDASQVLAWAAELYRPVISAAPFQFTPDYARGVFARHFDPEGPWSELLGQFAYPRALLFLNRINLGLPSVLGGLRAQGPWSAIVEECVARGRALGAT